MKFAVTNGGVPLMNVRVSQVDVAVSVAFLFLWSKKKYFTFHIGSMCIISLTFK